MFNLFGWILYRFKLHTHVFLRYAVAADVGCKHRAAGPAGDVGARRVPPRAVGKDRASTATRQDSRLVRPLFAKSW